MGAAAGLGFAAYENLAYLVQHAEIWRSLAALRSVLTVPDYAGNRYFNPLLEGSGYGGAAGGYRLDVVATDLGLGPNGGPAVLSADPAAGNHGQDVEVSLDLNSSPLK